MRDPTLLMRITWVDYDTVDGTLWVRVAGRSADGRRRVVNIEGCEPYFFAPRDEPIPDDDRIERIEPVAKTFVAPNPEHPAVGYVEETPYRSYDGKPAVKVVVGHPDDIDGGDDEHEHGLMGHYTETWEADIPFDRRVAADYNLSGYIELPDTSYRHHINDVDTNPPEPAEPILPRVCMADIETRVDPDASIEETINRTHMPVIAFTLYDTYEEDYECIVMDPEGTVDTSEVRRHLEEHWADYDEKENDTNGSIVIHRVTREQDLFDCWIDYMEERRFDLISGWNWTGFDHPYLLGRLEREYHDRLNKHALSDVGGVGGFPPETAIGGVPGFDMMKGFCDKMSFTQWRSKALDYVSTVELEIGKNKEAKWSDYVDDRSLFTAYNIIDVQLTVELDKKNGIHEFFYQLADLSHVQIYDTFSAMRLVDGYILARRDPTELLPNAEERELERNKGGLVLDPYDGVEDWVAVLDYKSLYPSVMATLNISRETLRPSWSPDRLTVPAMPESEEAVGNRRIEASDIAWQPEERDTINYVLPPPDTLPIYTSLEKEGILSKYVRRLFPEREQYKDLRNEHEPGTLLYAVYDRKQAAVKVLMNSFYGVATSSYYRLAEEGLGDAITAVARYVLWTGVEVAEEMGYPVLYGDTDSKFISLLRPGEDPDDLKLEDALERGRELQDAINEQMDRVADALGVPKEGHPYLINAGLHGSRRHAIKVEFEKLYRRWLQYGKKKRYAGLIRWKEGKVVDKIDFTGIEARRSDTPELTTEVQPGVLDLLLRGADFREVSEYLREHIDAVEKGAIPIQRIAVPKRYNPPYKVAQLVERAVDYSTEYLGASFNPGDKPYVYYVARTAPGDPPTDVIAREWYEDLPTDYTLDTEEHLRKALKDPLKPLLGMMGWSFSELRHGQRQAALTDLYGEDPWA